MPEYIKHPTIIFFNPNAQCYQQQVHSPNAFWLKFFLTSQINVMIWNYRAYGRSTGIPDPYSTFHDAESILRFMIQQLGIKDKIGCFGRSLGGTVATHLASNYPKLIDFLFVDRSFGTLEKMATSLFIGKRSMCLFKVFTFGGWPVRSDLNFFEAKCFKMLSQDPCDEMVDQYCALNAHVAKLACHENIGEKRHTSLKILQTYNAMRVLYKIDSFLFVELKKQIKLQKKLAVQKRKKDRHMVHENYYDSTADYKPLASEN